MELQAEFPEKEDLRELSQDMAQFQKRVRIVEKNIIYVRGLPKQLLKPAVLKKKELFGQYGRIKKVLIKKKEDSSRETDINIIYSSPLEASIAILCTNNHLINNKKLKVSFGMRKFCVFFLQRQPCVKRKCAFKHMNPFQKDNILRFKRNSQNKFNFITEDEVLFLIQRWGVSLDKELPKA